MASEVTANSSAADSDGSVSWEDFFGTTTDLVPQLLGMFDELARRKDQVNNPTSDQIPAALQKRLSLVASQRNTIFGQICGSAGYKENMTEKKDQQQMPDVRICHDYTNDKTTNEQCTFDTTNTDRLAPPDNNTRQRKQLGRPLSGSSIASSTSSSGGSNQENAASANPYLASVESLADACASSQASVDSGVCPTTPTAPTSPLHSPINRRKPTINEDSTFRNNVELVLSEIVDTEAIYVEHLRQVIQGYLIIWRDDPNSHLTHYELTNLFNNIEDIFKFNSCFLEEIKECRLEPISVANTFIKHNAGFKVYTEYCTNYPRAVSILTDLMSRDETAKAFRERQEALGHALPLGSFLLKPVQRILKYHLLLENLSKEFEAEDQQRHDFKEGKMTIDEALKAMTGIAEHINAMKRKHEHAVRVQEIQSLLYGWTGADLTTNGELIAEGRFRMRGAKAPRHAFLFDKMLLLTKKKEDGLLVYKAHIMCSNLMLIESIPGEPFSFHVIPFDNPRLQYTLQARNLEQKREWTLQIKRVMLENYNAVIPIHARQLVLQLGQSQHEDDGSTDKISMKKLYSSPPEYLERRKQEKDRRRIEARGKKLAQKFDSPDNAFSLSSSSSTTSSSSGAADASLNRSLDARASKVKDRLTSWRRKSEPGFQSYVSFTQSDDEETAENREENTEETHKNREEEPEKNVNKVRKNVNNNSPETPESSKESVDFGDSAQSATNLTLFSGKPDENANKSNLSSTKDVNIQPQTVEQIVGHILMQNEEFQRLLEKQRNNSIANVRQQRFHKETVDTSDDSDNGSDYRANNRITRATRITGVARGREHRSARSNNKSSKNAPAAPVNSTASNLRLQYNNLKTDTDHQPKAHDKVFKRGSILTESKIIKTALRMASDDSKANDFNGTDGSEMRDDQCPTRPSVWLTKLCDDLPTSPQKSGSLPRSFQINSDKFSTDVQKINKARFLQRDGKPLNERPFTIASDKPAEINLEDMERYSYQSDEQNQLSTTELNSASTFFCSLEDNSTVDSDSDRIHPDHKIYRNTLGSGILKNVLSKAGSRLQGLRLTLSTETLESTDSISEKKGYRNFKGNKKRSKSRLLRLSRESSTDVDEPVIGCVPNASADPTVNGHDSVYYKQGSPRLGARIAQADYADPSVLFGSYFEAKRAEEEAKAAEDEDRLAEGENRLNEADNELEVTLGHIKVEEEREEFVRSEEEDEEEEQRKESDCFYEKSFETIENCGNWVEEGRGEGEFRDSAIFSDGDEVVKLTPDENRDEEKSVPSPESQTIVTRISRKSLPKIPPPVPIKKQQLGAINLSTLTKEQINLECSPRERINFENSTTERVMTLVKPRLSLAKQQINADQLDFVEKPALITKNQQIASELKNKSNNLRNNKPTVAVKPDNLRLRQKIVRKRDEISQQCIKVTLVPSNANEGVVKSSLIEGSDISSGQSQAGWVKKMVGQLQAQIETT